MYHFEITRRPDLYREVPPTEQPGAPWSAAEPAAGDLPGNPTVTAMLGVIAAEARGEPAPRGGLFHIH